MSVTNWCKSCDTVVSYCQSSLDHKKEEWGWRTDYRVGGRWGERFRKWFKIKETALADERQAKADHDRGVYKPRESLSKILFSDVLDRYYKEHCLINCRKAEVHTRYMIKVVREQLGNRPAVLITRKDIKEMRTAMVSAGKSAAYVNRLTHGVVGAAFSWAVEEEILSTNPCDNLPKLRIEEPEPRFLTKAEIDHVYQFFVLPKLRIYADTIYHTGARPSSIKECSFDSGDVNFESKHIWFTTYKGRRNSLKKHRYAVPMDKHMEAILRQRFEETGGKGLVFDTSGVDKLARHAIEASKINENKTTPFTIYGLKHCYASHLLMSGATLHAVSKLLGHTDSKMVEKHYGFLAEEYLRREQAKLGHTPEFKVIEPDEKIA